MTRARNGIASVLLLGTALSGSCKRKNLEPTPIPPVEKAAMSAAPVVPEANPNAGLPPTSVPVLRTGETTVMKELAGASAIAAIHYGPKQAPAIAGAGNGWLRIVAPDGKGLGEAKAPGVGQRILQTDVDGDKHLDLVVGRGRGVGALEDPARIDVYRSGDLRKAAESIPLPPSERAEVIGLAADPARSGRLFVGFFESKYEVAIVSAVRGKTGTWSTEPVTKIRMAYDFALADFDKNGESDFAISRVYGDAPLADGEVLTLIGGVMTKLPSTRGARALTIRGTGAEIYYSDGWHANYGRIARGLVSRAVRDGDGWKRDILANIEGRHSFDHLRFGEFGGPVLVASGNGPAVMLHLDGKHTLENLGDWPAYDAIPVDLDGDGRDEIVGMGTGTGTDTGRIDQVWVYRPVATP